MAPLAASCLLMLEPMMPAPMTTTFILEVLVFGSLIRSCNCRREAQQSRRGRVHTVSGVFEIFIVCLFYSIVGAGQRLCHLGVLTHRERKLLFLYTFSYVIILLSVVLHRQPHHTPTKRNSLAQQRPDMPKAKAKPSHVKQQQKRTSSKPYHRNRPKQQLKTARTHKGVAATLAKALSAQCINSMLADTASELQEAGIKQRPSSRGGCKVQHPQQQQQSQQQRLAQPPPAEQQQQQLRQQAVQQQQEQPPQQQQQQPDLMSMLGSWSMRQQPDEQQQPQQPSAS